MICSFDLTAAGDAHHLLMKNTEDICPNSWFILVLTQNSLSSGMRWPVSLSKAMSCFKSLPEQPRNKTLAWVFVCFARVVSIFLIYESHDLQITCIWADCLIRRRRGRGDVPRDGPCRRRLNAFCSHLCGNKSRKCSSWKLDTLNETWGRFIRVRDRKLKHLVLYMFNVSVQWDEFTYYGLVLPSHGHHMVMCLEP